MELTLEDLDLDLVVVEEEDPSQSSTTTTYNQSHQKENNHHKPNLKKNVYSSSTTSMKPPTIFNPVFIESINHYAHKTICKPCPLCQSLVSIIWCSLTRYMELCTNNKCLYPFNLPFKHFSDKFGGQPITKKPIRPPKNPTPYFKNGQSIKRGPNNSKQSNVINRTNKVTNSYFTPPPNQIHLPPPPVVSDPIPVTVDPLLFFLGSDSNPYLPSPIESPACTSNLDDHVNTTHDDWLNDILSEMPLTTSIDHHLSIPVVPASQGTEPCSVSEHDDLDLQIDRLFSF